MAKNPYYDDGTDDEVGTWDDAGTVEPSVGGPPPKADEALPEWARISADISEEEPKVQPATPVSPYGQNAGVPQNPATQLPPANAPMPAQPIPAPAPPVPAPAQPVPAPAPPVPAPAQPVPAPAPPVPAPAPPAPAPAPPAPETSLHDLAPRETVSPPPAFDDRPRPSQRSSDRPAFTPGGLDDYREQENYGSVRDYDSEEEDVIVPGKKKKGLFGKSNKQEPKKASKNVKTRSRGKYAGGRSRLLIMRVLVWGVIGIVGLAGIRALLFPAAPDLNAISQRVGKQYNLTTFPNSTGQAIAVQFADVYLNINPEFAAERTEQLTSYLANAVNADWAELAPQAAPQVVCAGPYVLEPPEIFEGADGQNATYLVGAQVAPKPGKTSPCSSGQPGEWVYLDVTVFAPYEGGGLVIGGQPGFVPAPEKGTLDGAFQYVVDKAVVEPLTADLTNYFTAWAASDEAGMKPYLAPNATRYVVAGMAGTVKFEKIENVSPEKVESETAPRFATVDVTWSAGGNLWVQAYRLQVIRNNNVWQVADLYGGGFGR